MSAKPLSPELPADQIYGYALKIELASGPDRKREEVMLAHYRHEANARASAGKRTGFLRILEVIPLTEEQFLKLREVFPAAKNGQHQLARTSVNTRDWNVKQRIRHHRSS